MTYIGQAGIPLGVPASIGVADYITIAPAANEVYGMIVAYTLAFRFNRLALELAFVDCCSDYTCRDCVAKLPRVDL